MFPTQARNHFPTGEELTQILAHPDINGEQGINRASKTENQFRSDTDYEVIQEYLRLQCHSLKERV